VTSFEDLDRSGERENVFTPLAGEDFQSDFVKEVGVGMVAHIGRLEYAEEPRHGEVAEWQIRPELIRRPVNADGVMEIIRKLRPDPVLVVETSADAVVDLCRRMDTGEGLVHVFNVSWAKGEEASASVTFRWPEEVKSLTWIGWDREETGVDFSSSGAEVSFELAGIRESAVVVINMKRA